MKRYHVLKIVLRNFYEEFKKSILDKTYDPNFFNKNNILKQGINDEFLNEYDPEKESKRISFLMNINLKELESFFENEN